MDNSLIVEGLNITELDDDELAQRLQELGFNPGPIVATTRSVYQRKLARLMRNESFVESEENDVDDEVRPTPLHSTLLYSPGPSYKSPSTSFAGANFYTPPPLNYDDLRRRPLSRDAEMYSMSSGLSSNKPFSADDIVSQVAPPPFEPEKPLLSPTVKIIGLAIIVLFALFVYFNMESTPVNPFTTVPDSNL
ncbi:LEM domain-containing protein [Caerostris darwini]|uniref:LEM domain-containing protein n=1 Tax=Caerostris darwini TaxID=1538125 RepID=A0AAV4P4U0_9ARAC|nr:LEM domain-containing protein [Caerostris darwini]